MIKIRELVAGFDKAIDDALRANKADLVAKHKLREWRRYWARIADKIEGKDE